MPVDYMSSPLAEQVELNLAVCEDDFLLWHTSDVDLFIWCPKVENKNFDMLHFQPTTNLVLEPGVTNYTILVKASCL